MSMHADVERKATLKLTCPACGIEWTIKLSTEKLMIEQELVTVRIDEDKRIEDIINNLYIDEPGAVREWRATISAVAENTLRGVRCACF